MDALGVAIMGAGAFLVYSSIKGKHPWDLFQAALSGTQASTAATAAEAGPGTSVGDAGAVGSAAVGSIVQTSAGPIKVH